MTRSLSLLLRRMGLVDRFYCPDPPTEGRVILSGDEARHLARVRRLVVGDSVEIFDGRGFSSRAEVTALERDRAELTLQGAPLPERKPPISLTLATAVPKGERFDWLVEKATELGVARIVPLLTERSVVDPRAAKLDRLRRLTIEASKQCGRSHLPQLDPPMPFSRLVSEFQPAIRLLADPTGAPAACWPRVPSGSAAVFAIGPEGGFTPVEVALARESGWFTAALGATLLRIETAAVTGSAIFLALSGECNE